MVKTVPLTKCNTVTNYKGVKMDPHKPFLTVSRGGQLLRVGGFNPLIPPPPTNTALHKTRLKNTSTHQYHAQTCTKTRRHGVKSEATSELSSSQSFTTQLLPDGIVFRLHRAHAAHRCGHS